MVRRLRFLVGLSQNKLARATGIDPAYVNRIEKGSVVHPSRLVMLQLAEVLELTTNQTDRLLYAAGLATQVDWQTRATKAEVVIASLRMSLADYEEGV